MSVSRAGEPSARAFLGCIDKRLRLTSPVDLAACPGIRKHVLCHKIGANEKAKRLTFVKRPRTQSGRWGPTAFVPQIHEIFHVRKYRHRHKSSFERRGEKHYYSAIYGGLSTFCLSLDAAQCMDVARCSTPSGYDSGGEIPHISPNFSHSTELDNVATALRHHLLTILRPSLEPRGVLFTSCSPPGWLQARRQICVKVHRCRRREDNTSILPSYESRLMSVRLVGWHAGPAHALPFYSGPSVTWLLRRDLSPWVHHKYLTTEPLRTILDLLKRPKGAVWWKPAVFALVVVRSDVGPHVEGRKQIGECNSNREMIVKPPASGVDVEAELDAVAIRVMLCRVVMGWGSKPGTLEK
ncbi:hypothetical protein FA13DRAFT_1920734 [Coprinellus micaceus]|uniref:Uncharacterized protein n=1 Tax=Coprinellus micaceus TaxID=71717 RepID=A0A4Y7SKX7_COPMI|nr:hypothetical protein FA13DRAFT_1920734 [Coprinellus micaceus]